jgi:dipeptide/tripeptide permease
MSDAPAAQQTSGWSYPRTFWIANGAELCERAAFYGMFITLFRYLNISVGFSDIETGWITGAFASILYFLPTFMGLMADKIGFKRALLLAFALLTAGYALLGALQLKSTALVALALIMCGGAIIKPVISGTVAKTSSDVHRARAMSIFYMVVNIGAFTGKSVAGPMNQFLGLQYINFYAATMAFIALVLVAVLYRNPDTEGTGKTLEEALLGLGKVMLNFRFLALILIIGGFWAIQGQLYSSMPTFIERMLGKGYKPEWLANINPLVVVLLVVPITHLVRNFKPANAIGIGLLIIPFTALVVALAPYAETLIGGNIPFAWPTAAGFLVGLGIIGLFVGAVVVTTVGVRAGIALDFVALLLLAVGLLLHFQADQPFFYRSILHPLILMFIIGIALQGLAECFLSPKWLEFASKQAPPGEVGLYLGYSHLTTFFAWLFGFILAGYLLAGFCPDPKTLLPETRHEWRLATDPNYRFALPDAAFDDVTTGPIDAELRAAFVEAGVTLPADAALTQDEPEARWATKTEDAWDIETPDETYHINRVTYDVGDLPDDLVAKLRGDGDPLIEIVDADGALNVVEYVVLTESARPQSELGALPKNYEHAHYLWYAFAIVGFAAFFALLIFKFVTERADRARADQPPAAT